MFENPGGPRPPAPAADAHVFDPCNGVARVSWARRKNIFAPTPTKMQSLKWKIGEKAVEKTNSELLFVIFVIFRSNEVRFNDRNALNKAISIDGSNKARSIHHLVTYRISCSYLSNIDLSLLFHYRFSTLTKLICRS